LRVGTARVLQVDRSGIVAKKRVTAHDGADAVPIPPTAVAKLASLSTLTEDQRVELMCRVRVGVMTVDEAVALAAVSADDATSPDNPLSRVLRPSNTEVGGSGAAGGALPPGLSGGQWKEMTVELEGTTLRFSHPQDAAIVVLLTAEVIVTRISDVPYEGVESLRIAVPGHADVYFFTERVEETTAWRQSIESAVAHQPARLDADADDVTEAAPAGSTTHTSSQDQHTEDARSSADGISKASASSQRGSGKSDKGGSSTVKTATATATARSEVPAAKGNDNPLGNTSSEDEDEGDDRSRAGGGGGGGGDIPISSNDTVDESEEEVFTPVRITHAPTVGEAHAVGALPSPLGARDAKADVGSTSSSNGGDENTAVEDGAAADGGGGGAAAAATAAGAVVVDPWETVSPSLEGQRISSRRSFKTRVSFSRFDSQTSFRGISVSGPGVEMVVPEYDEDVQRAAELAKAVGQENPVVVRDECDERVGGPHPASCRLGSRAEYLSPHHDCIVLALLCVSS
jgi:hypothetical protein